MNGARRFIMLAPQPNHICGLTLSAHTQIAEPEPEVELAAAQLHVSNRFPSFSFSFTATHTWSWGSLFASDASAVRSVGKRSREIVSDGKKTLFSAERPSRKIFRRVSGAERSFYCLFALFSASDNISGIFYQNQRIWYSRTLRSSRYSRTLRSSPLCLVWYTLVGSMHVLLLEYPRNCESKFDVAFCHAFDQVGEVKQTQVIGDTAPSLEPEPENLVQSHTSSSLCFINLLGACHVPS